MGRINRFLCPSCRMTWQIQLGHGFRHALLENVLEAFPEDIREKILADSNIRRRHAPNAARYSLFP